ncbi:V/A-type H+-transporting ATPase subunit F [Caloramator quimbayensis]|uniref:V/A-type H+-transporting ATPase subunit F n=1 Tax=Caloramator quimbayensis TaxID=1147123 RepID=A0A1T4XLU7_9CLOT|nr:V-type ATP synthase subunit F [Caloramator quimbayensis]SKA90530.1 V/A-type H+-transporting ATPase subunit F [Caloramator quimbayensis]
MNIYLISDNRDTLVGMRLAGIKGLITSDKKEAEKLLDSLIKDKDIMIIIITEKLAEAMRDKINNIKQKMKLPLIVEIPDRHGSIKDEDYITGYVRDSIGIKI